MTASAKEYVATINTIGAGALGEKFDAALAEVLKNIKDPNTEAEATRKITLEIAFTPTSDRESVAVTIRAKTGLATNKPTSDVMYVGSRDGEPVATVVRSGEDPRQGALELHRTAAGESK